MAALHDALGVEVKLIKGRGGIFEVSVDGAVVARKGLSGFPTEEQIVAAVRSATSTRT